jgi:predicted regulator of amino acid metabolism with ACT domain
MWEPIEAYFIRRSAARKVVEAFLRYGFCVDENGTIFAGPVELAPAKIGRALEVDRRVVIETAKEISKDKSLFSVFSKLQPRAFGGLCSKTLGFDCIQIEADAHASGIVSEVTKVLYENNIKIRQIIADDPELFPNPKLSIILDGKISSTAFSKLRSLPFAQKITLH